MRKRYRWQQNLLGFSRDELTNPLLYGIIQLFTTKRLTYGKI